MTRHIIFQFDFFFFSFWLKYFRLLQKCENFCGKARYLVQLQEKKKGEKKKKTSKGHELFRQHILSYHPKLKNHSALICSLQRTLLSRYRYLYLIFGFPYIYTITDIYICVCVYMYIHLHPLYLGFPSEPKEGNEHIRM